LHSTFILKCNLIYRFSVRLVISQKRLTFCWFTLCICWFTLCTLWALARELIMGEFHTWMSVRHSTVHMRWCDGTDIFIVTPPCWRYASCEQRLTQNDEKGYLQTILYNSTGAYNSTHNILQTYHTLVTLLQYFYLQHRGVYYYRYIERMMSMSPRERNGRDSSNVRSPSSRLLGRTGQLLSASLLRIYAPLASPPLPFPSQGRTII